MPVETKNGPQNFKVSLTQMMPWFGTLKDKENSYISASKSKYEKFEDSKSELFFSVKTTFYDLYFIQKEIDITQENIDILKALKRLVIMKIETGKASSVDELRIEIDLNNLTNSLALLKDKWLVYRVKFNNLLHVENNTKVVVPKRLWTDDLQYNKQELIQRIKTDNHQIKSYNFLKESSLHNEKFVFKQGKPKLLFGVDYTSIGDKGTSPFAGKDALQLKVGISIPLYRKKYSSMLKESKIQQQIIDDKKEDKINTLETLFEKVYNEYNDANRRLILFEKQDELAARAIQLLEICYANSGRKFEDNLRM
jgi:outer membrane protein TolC